MKMRVAAMLLVGLATALFLVSCKCDPVAPPAEGTITLAVSPPGLAAGWELAGPDGFSLGGAGSTTVVGVAAGDYTVAWGDVDGRITPSPNPAAFTVVAGQETRVEGVYVEAAIPVGSIAITVVPSDMEAAWTLSGPDGYAAAGTGAAALDQVPVGDYTITWGAVANWQAPDPNPATFSVTADQTSAVAGVYALPFPDTAEQLMANFVNAYNARDFRILRESLHPDFVTLLQPATVQLFPAVGETLDLAQELRSAQRLLSGEPVVDPDGLYVPAVTHIDFQSFTQMDAWSTSINPQIPDTGDAEHPVQRSLYYVNVVLSRGQSFSALKVEGELEFYITSRDSLDDGILRRYYTMRGQKDLTRDQKAVALTLWGTVKALYR